MVKNFNSLKISFLLAQTRLLIRHIFNLTSIWLILLSLWATMYFYGFLLPYPKPLSSWFMYYEPQGVLIRFAQSNPLVIYFLSLGLLSVVWFCIPFAKMVSWVFKTKPIKHISRWWRCDKIRACLIGIFTCGMILIITPHVMIIALGIFLVLGSVKALGDHTINSYCKSNKKLLGFESIGLWCRDQMASQKTAGDFELLAIISCNLVQGDLIIESINTGELTDVTPLADRERRDQKGVSSSVYLGALIPPSTRQVLGVQKVLDLFRRILDGKIPLQDGSLRIKLKCRLSSDVNLAAAQPLFCLPNQRLEIEECQLLPIQERHI